MCCALGFTTGFALQVGTNGQRGQLTKPLGQVDLHAAGQAFGVSRRHTHIRACPF